MIPAAAPPTGSVVVAVEPPAEPLAGTGPTAQARPVAAGPPLLLPVDQLPVDQLPSGPAGQGTVATDPAPAQPPSAVVGQAAAVVRLRGPVVLVLPMGAGLVLIGLGLALVGLRLRRG